MVGRNLIYFDNAATSYPKPEVVYREHDAYFRTAGNPGRGAHRLALESARLVFESRNTISDFLGIDNPERLIFTPGATYSINTVLRGFPWNKAGSAGRSRPAAVIVGPLEHNAVVRPLYRLERQGVITIHRLKYVPGRVIDFIELKKQIAELKPALCAIQEGSNVTGEFIDISSAWDICEAANVSLLIDAAQTAGYLSTNLFKLPTKMPKSGDTARNGAALFWCASGHKSLFGPPGVGLLFASADAYLEPLIAGGTGSNSENLEMPENCPDRLEAGTMPAHLIGALASGVSWLKQEGIAKVCAHESALVKQFLSWCLKQKYIKVFGRSGLDDLSGSGIDPNKIGLPVVSFEIEGVPADRIADWLDRDFGIAVRSGLHCAVAAHQALGTLSGGLTRASFGYFNTTKEVDVLCRAISKIYHKQRSG